MDMDQLEFFFEIPRCVQWICDNNFQRTCLQFPDDLLDRAVDVLARIEELSGRRLYMLADTTYRSCCVDEKTAQHINGDSLIHFGHSCLSSTNNRIPILFIFTNTPFDSPHLLTLLTSQYPAQNDVKLILMGDCIYQNHLQRFYSESIKETYPNAFLSDIISPSDQEDSISLNRTLPPNLSGDPSSFVILYIGSPSHLYLQLLKLPKIPFVVYNPQSPESGIEERSSDLGRFLMKRSYYVEKLKQNTSIGILVGTLAVEKYLEVIANLKKILQSAGKTVHIVSIGQINSAKLANFPDIQVFVHVACPESIMFDSKDYFQPIVTPFEVELAFGSKNTSWEDYLLDFKDLLTKGLLEPCQVEIDSITSSNNLFTWNGLSEGPPEHEGGVHKGLSGIASHYKEEPIDPKP